jgi:hypothetical protein
MRNSELYRVYKDVSNEMDDNKDLVCGVYEMMMMFLPIIPHSFWNRLLLVCFYVVLYNVKAHDRYFEMKERYLNAPKKMIDVIEDETDSEVEIILLEDEDGDDDEDDYDDEDEGESDYQEETGDETGDETGSGTDNETKKDK